MTAKSVTITLRAGVTHGTLPDIRKMRFGVDYAISLDEYSKISRVVRETIVDTPTINITDYVLPIWNGTDYALDLTTISGDTLANINSVITWTQDGSTQYETFEAGDVIQGFNGSAFKLVENAGAVAAVAGTANVAVWVDSDIATTDVDKGTQVSVDTSADGTDFAGVFINGVAAGEFGWIQIAGTVEEAAGTFAAGDEVRVDVVDGTFAPVTLPATEVSVGTALASGATTGTVALRDSTVLNRHIKRAKLFFEK